MQRKQENLAKEKQENLAKKTGKSWKGKTGKSSKENMKILQRKNRKFTVNSIIYLHLAIIIMLIKWLKLKYWTMALKLFTFNFSEK